MTSTENNLMGPADGRLHSELCGLSTMLTTLEWLRDTGLMKRAKALTSYSTLLKTLGEKKLLGCAKCSAMTRSVLDSMLFGLRTQPGFSGAARKRFMSGREKDGTARLVEPGPPVLEA